MDKIPSVFIRVHPWFLLFVFAVTNLALAASPPTSRPTKAVNPHWNRTRCAECHTIDNNKKLPITAQAADEICLKCHDGVKASYEFHPVGRRFDGEKYTRPKTWPLVEDRLACLTCHDLLPGCDENIQRPGANRMFLRDFSAGRAKSKPFCQNCHQASAYQKLNPHIMLLAEKKEIIEEKCLFCHDKPLNTKTGTRSGEPALKADQLSLCRDCHPQHKDVMNTNHLTLRVNPDMEAYIATREVLGLTANISPELIKQVKNSGAKPTRIVPGPNGTILCSTCHNPHQSGVFPIGSPLSFRAMKLTSEGLLVSPVHNQTWCRHCHD